MLDNDIVVDIHFYPTAEGGRESPTTDNIFGSIFVVDDEKHDCRLFLSEVGSIKPGESRKNVPIKFLCPELVISKLSIGKKFYLWDMRLVAEGEVKKLGNCSHF